jgi:hypothetical protein
MQQIIDFHMHAFPDALAEQAMVQLLSETDGTCRCYLVDANHLHCNSSLSD